MLTTFEQLQWDYVNREIIPCFCVKLAWLTGGAHDEVRLSWCSSKVRIVRFYLFSCQCCVCVPCCEFQCILPGMQSIRCLLKRLFHAQINSTLQHCMIVHNGTETVSIQFFLPPSSFYECNSFREIYIKGVKFEYGDLNFLQGSCAFLAMHDHSKTN